MNQDNGKMVKSDQNEAYQQMTHAYHEYSCLPRALATMRRDRSDNIQDSKRDVAGRKSKLQLFLND
ncbi:MAG: hypothetical protein WC824_03885 [Bacteroidota bacterium]|jgi:hypothetical protein